MRRFFLAVCASFALLLSNAFAQPINLSFEQTNDSGQVVGWFNPTAADGPTEISLVNEDSPEGSRHLKIQFSTNASSGFSNVMQRFDATPYRGKRVRFKAAVRLESLWGAAQLWMRVDRKDDKIGFFDNMDDRQIRDTAWRYYTIEGDVAHDANDVNIGMFVVDGATAHLDNVTFEVTGDAPRPDYATDFVASPPRALTQQGLGNLIALSKLYGYVRYFYPSIRSRDENWETFLARAIPRVEAASPKELRETLTALFEPLAPMLRLTESSTPPTIELPTNGSTLVRWEHFGVKSSQGRRSLYWSEILDSARSKLSNPWLPPTRLFTRRLVGKLHAHWPSSLPADSYGALPRFSITPAKAIDPELFSAEDRTTRLAGVIVAWNVFQHFYPYFDVVPTDWEAVLPMKLTKAAKDSSTLEYGRTVRSLLAELYDGHARATGNTMTGMGHYYSSPFSWELVEGKLLITHVGSTDLDLKRGDVVTHINGKPATQAIEEMHQYHSAATTQDLRFSVLNEMKMFGRTPTFDLTIERPGVNTPIGITIKEGRPTYVAEPRPGKIVPLKSNVWYVDLSEVEDADITRYADSLAQAQGVIFDLRGYPTCSPMVLGMLTDTTITCARWNIPEVIEPDRENMQFSFSNWDVEPVTPRIKGKVVFLTDGRAISYAETVMGIVEHYKLGTIVGEATAGTNGNVNSFSLPGGYDMMWTGMKVLKHDGSRHHGVGIKPTIPIRRTIKGIREGRDEYLERAFEVVGGRQ